MKFQRICDQLCPADQEAIELYAGLRDGDVVEVQVVVSKRRTGTQNNSMWKYCDALAKALTDAGFDARTFPWKDGISIDFTKEMVMHKFWRPVMAAMLDKKSTKEMTTKQVNEIYMVVDRAVSERTGVSVEFPSIEK